MSDEVQKVITDAVLDHIAEVIELLYQPKVTGKGLSTNDFTNELKSKLGISKGTVSGLVSSVPDITGVGPFDLAKWIQDKQTGV